MVVSSIFGTNSIEGGTLSEEETQLALDLGPEQVQEVKQRRVLSVDGAKDEFPDDQPVVESRRNGRYESLRQTNEKTDRMLQLSARSRKTLIRSAR